MASQIIVCLALTIVVLIIIGSVESSPTTIVLWKRPKTGVVKDECLEDVDIKQKCQLCAKATKSNIVYPMCCKAEEEAREWCDEYLEYGIQDDS